MVKRIIIAGDNDDAGIKAVNDAAAIFVRGGLKVSISIPKTPKADWNDELGKISHDLR